MAASFEINHEGIRIVGYSAAGEQTWFALPEHDIGFDFGRAPRELLSINNIFLSHGHMDHAAGVAYYFSQRMFIDNAPGRLYAPDPLLDPIRELLRVWRDIDGQEPPAYLQSAIPGQDIATRRDLLVRPFEVNHLCRGRTGRFQALGFTLIEVRKKLKDEYHGLMGPQIVALKEKGIEVTRRIEMPLVTYCGDTGPGPFLELDYVRNSKVLLLECTFVEAEHRERARAGNHIHVQDLAEICPKLNNERIVLIHLTRRTNLSNAKKALTAVLGSSMGDRVSFLGEHRRRRRPTNHQLRQDTPSTPGG